MTRLRSSILIVLVLGPSVGSVACNSSARPNSPLAPGVSVTERERITNAHREAKRAARAGDPRQAEVHYRRAVAYYSDYAPAWNNLGVTLMDQERFLEANEAFQNAADLAPSDPRPVYNQGLLFFRRAYPREALPYFLTALKRDPHYLPALRAAVQTEVRLRETSEQTLERIRTALQLETNAKWLSFFKLQRHRIEAELSSKQTRRLGEES